MIDKSVRYGISVADELSDLQTQIFGVRKKILLEAVKGDFRQIMITRREHFFQAMQGLFVVKAGKINELIESDLEKSYNDGVGASDKAIKHYQDQGLQIESKESELDKSGINNLIQTFTMGLIGIFATVSATQMQDYNVITNLVNVEAEDLTAEIDRVQRFSLDKGLIGKILSNGTEKSAVAEVEFMARNGTHQALLQGQSDRLQEVGMQPLVQVSAHPNCCELCQPWETRILIDDVYQNGQADGKHELLSTAIEAGLFHWNCRHNLIPYVYGYDKPDLFEKDKVTKAEAAKGYAFEQRQREIERNIRDWKTREAGSLSDRETLLAKNKVAEWQAMQRGLLRQAERENVTLTRQYVREQIGGGTLPRLPRLR